MPSTNFRDSADGRRVLADRPDGTWALFPIDGGAGSPFSGIERGEETIRFTRDGRSLFVSRTAEVPLRVYRVDVATGARSLWKELGPSDRAGLSYVRNAVASADGSTYAYQYRRWLSELYLIEGIR